MRWEEEGPSFDVDLLALHALDEPNAMAFIDAVISGKHADAAKFKKASKGSARDETTQETGADDSTQDEPDFIANPLPRPTGMPDLALEMERQITSKSGAGRLRDLAETIKGHPDLTTDEAAYLIDYAKRRAWQIEHNVSPDKAPAGKGKSK
jgi:hypothetical protein